MVYIMQMVYSSRLGSQRFTVIHSLLYNWLNNICDKWTSVVFVWTSRVETPKWVTCMRIKHFRFLSVVNPGVAFAEKISEIYWTCYFGSAKKCEMNAASFTVCLVVGFIRQTMACVSFQSCLLPSRAPVSCSNLSEKCIHNILWK